MEQARRTATVTLPRELTDAVDAIVGEAARDSYVADVVRVQVQRDQERTRRAKQSESLKGLRGILADVTTPEWDTPERASQWVHDLRRSDRRNGDQ
jgi:Arc/MetJ-type ribon-helix-helix transcriptional regulator